MTDNSKGKWAGALIIAGLITVLAAAGLPMAHVARDTTGYVYAAGAAALLAGRLLSPTPAGASVRLRRLLRMEVWTALIFVAGAVFLFLPQAGGNDWIAFTLAGGLLPVYTSIMKGSRSVTGEQKGKKR